MRRPSSVPTWCRERSPAGPRPTPTWSPARCSTRPPRTCAGSTCSARRAPSTPSSPSGCFAPAPRCTWACGCTPTRSCPRASPRSPRGWARRPARLALHAGPTVATVLPACDLSTRAPLAPARELLDAGAVIAIASNCNPGTSYTSAMSFCVTTAVLQMHLSLAEAVRAATRGGALALRRTDVGHLAVGARADLHVLDAPAAIHLAYRPGMPLTHQVWKAGHPIP